MRSSRDLTERLRKIETQTCDHSATVSFPVLTLGGELEQMTNNIHVFERPIQKCNPCP